MRVTNKNILISILLVCLAPFYNCVHSQNMVDTLLTDNSQTINKDDKLTSPENNISNFQDSASTKFNAKRLILPGALILAGAIGVIDHDNNLNKSVNEAMTDLSHNKQFKADDYLRFVPSAAHLLMGSLGIKSRHSFKERLLVSATAHAAMLAMGYGTKFIIHEQRPDMSDNHSLPSGHVAMAFTGAELLREEYGTLYGIAGYTIATGVAFLRLYNNRHWFNDVVMGAGIGILSARIGFWLLPLERKLFKINQQSPQAAIVTAIPVYSPTHHAIMLSMNAVF